MSFPSDIEIAQNAKILPINEIAKKLNIPEVDLEFYGKYKAKLPLSLQKKNQKGKLILVSAMSPTKYGEGKTTMSIGLTDGLNYIGEKAKQPMCLLHNSNIQNFGNKFDFFKFTHARKKDFYTPVICFGKFVGFGTSG